MSENLSRGLSLLRSKPAIAVSLLLIAELVAFRLIPTQEYVPSPPPLNHLASTLGPWRTVNETPIDAYTQSLLRSDDSLSRNYAGPGAIELFVAFFKSQRAGVTPHSPKVCLPGNGWTPEESRIVSITVPGETSSIPVNRYIVRHDDERDLVFYWYQNTHRVTANEYFSKFYLIYDALRYHRSDEALIRVTIRVGDDPKAEEHALQFIRDLYEPLKRQMWSAPSSADVRPQSAELR